MGKITQEWYDELQQSWNWTPDTVNLSKAPIKTQIAFAYGKDADGVLKMVLDANSNLDLSDDTPFTPLEADSIASDADRDSIALAHAVDVSIEIFIHNQVAPVSIPCFVMFYNQINMFMACFLQYATTEYQGEQIAISGGFADLFYDGITLALTNNLKPGEKVSEEGMYRKNEYIEIKGKIYKIIGVNINRQTLELEKIDQPKSQLVSTQIGYKACPFEGEEFTSKSPLSLESQRGKYVLLDFWATWCGPCRQEMPNLKSLYAKIDPAKCEIIGIVGASSAVNLTPLIEEYEITWPQILSDETNKITDKYRINGYPTTLLIDPDGMIVAKNLRGQELEEKILSLTGK